MMTTDKKTELALRSANLIRNWKQMLWEIHTLYVSDLGDMESLANEIRDEYGFAPSMDDEGKPQGWMPLVHGDDPNAWQCDGGKQDA